ncbi:MAG: AraC family transcriptional regulator [Rhodothermales bacterium]|nr:AraC family transcriptional regulator [Rhodothermales bacterium]MBO6779201.1 AraC family transcriptional regulator [Rhodothermales bacterium]
MPSLWFVLPIAFGIVHGLLFAVLLAVRSGRRKTISDALLAGLVLAGALRLLPYVLSFLGSDVLWAQWPFLPLDTGLLIGPLFWFYLRSRTNARFHFRRSDLLHVAPWTLYAGYRLLVFSRDAEFVFQWTDRVDLPFVQPALAVLTGLSLGYYLWRSWGLLRRYRVWLDSEFVDVEPIQLGWLRSFVLAISVGVATAWVFGLLDLVSVRLDTLQAWWPFAITTATLYYLSLAGFMNPQPPGIAFEDRPRERLQGPASNLPVAALLDVMATERPYLNPSFCLDDLAALMNRPKALVSQSINEGLRTNFRGLVNAYRVDAVCEALKHESALTLVGVAMDQGFNSKATFNRVFKQYTGVTPREYANMTIDQRARIPVSRPAAIIPDPVATA